MILGDFWSVMYHGVHIAFLVLHPLNRSHFREIIIDIVIASVCTCLVLKRPTGSVFLVQNFIGLCQECNSVFYTGSLF